MDHGKLADLKPKTKCCRSKPRCKRPPQAGGAPSPVVIDKVHRAQLNGIRGKELTKVFTRARKS
ncbi:hypothetical protein [Mycolicibacterium pyrenivorans]|uniref:hypothetical protein n=1 Tax=Mycolicibacterium pyrenivorans TaxID=187102 RepID=UPI0021F2CB85|nr:hypothetical protein [Mycolicibacterium pyrenivorans]